MLRATVPVEAGNRAIANGSLAQVIQKVLALTQAEAAYFTAIDGKRTMLAFFEMKDSSLIPQIAEPLFSGLQAEVELTPVMNREELQQGLSLIAG